MEVEPILLETEKHPPLVSKFMDEMLPTKLFFHSPKHLYGRKLWVFWSHNTLEHTSINCHLQDRIKSALSCKYPFSLINGLVQFWAKEEIRGQLHLTTALQPFSLFPNEKMMEYRKHCVGYKLLVQEEESAGIVDRVFRNQLPELGQELKYYTIKEYPLRDLALSCGINSTLAVPVFEPSRQTCVGVLEILLVHTDYYFSSLLLKSVSESLQEQRLSTTDVGLIRSLIRHNEIIIAVEQVCKTYNLPLGVTWVSSKYISTSKKPQVSHQGELLVPCSRMTFSSASGSIIRDYGNTPLRGNQGLVGKAFSSGNLHFCKDACELSITEYPQVHIARKLGIAACFAVCLRNISTGNQEFVIEFSLSREMTIHSRDLHSLLYSILATMKQHLTSFEVITGDREIEIFTEVHKASEQNNNDLPSYETIRTPTTSEGDSSQSLRTTECSMNTTCRQPVLPSRKRVNESDQFISESSFPVNKSAKRAESESSGWGNSETASTKWVDRFGYMMSENQLEIPTINQSRRTESFYSGAPVSEASAIFADVEMVTEVELMPIKVSYRKNIIKFDLPPSSNYADLMENILNRWGFLKDKAFVIKFLDYTCEPILLATDTDLQKCMVRTRSKGIKLIRMVIHMEDDVQSMP